MTNLSSMFHIFSAPAVPSTVTKRCSFLKGITPFMDLLRNAYYDSSGDEPEPELKPTPEPEYPTIILPPSKRPKPEDPQILQREAPIPGRYVSKRERALSGQSFQVSDRVPNPNPNTHVVTSPGKICFLFLIHFITIISFCQRS